jgi:hypothetical protein
LAQLKNVDLYGRRENRRRIRECLVLDCPESGNRTRWEVVMAGYVRHLGILLVAMVRRVASVKTA